MTFELRALRICYAVIDEKNFNMGTPTDNIIRTSSASFDAIYNGTKYQLLNSGFDLTVEDIHTILDFLDYNRGFIENSIRKISGGY
jgi:hypothetical protein